MDNSSKDLNSTEKDNESSPGNIDFSGIPARVAHVVVDGVRRTKNDVIRKEAHSVFQCSTFQEMVQRSYEMKLRMERLGLFKKVGIYIDTIKGTASETSYEVVFRGKEFGRVSGDINTMVGNNDGQMLFGVKLPNLFGRGERVNLQYCYGTKQVRSYTLQFSKPVNANPDICLTGSAYQNHCIYPWSDYKETDRGLDLNLVHELVWDSRADVVLARSGYIFKLAQEYAGLGGNVEHTRHEMELQINKSVLSDLTGQLSVAGGVIIPFHAKHTSHITDRFFLGGPLTIRGFRLNGIGPHSDGNALGADSYWACAAHLYTPLPFLQSKGSFRELFRAHLFANAGNLGNISFSDVRRSLQEMSRCLRCSYGVGIVLRLSRIARLELNYVVPVSVQHGDRANPGLQFGIGLVYL